MMEIQQKFKKNEEREKRKAKAITNKEIKQKMQE